MGGKQFVCTAAAPVTVGATALAFQEMSDQSALNSNLIAVGQKADAAFHNTLSIGNFEDITFDVSENFVGGKDLYGAEYSGQGGNVVLTRPGAERGVTSYTWALAQFASIPTAALSGDVDYGILDIDQSHFGLSHDAGDATVTTTAQHAGYGLMPVTGVFTRDGDVVYNYPAYADLKRHRTSYETVCSGAVDAILRRCQSAFGAKPRIIISGSIRGGTQ